MHELIIFVVLLVFTIAYIAIVLVPKHKSTLPEKDVITEAEILIISGDNAKAISILESYLERYPNHEKAKYLLDAAKNIQE